MTLVTFKDYKNNFQAKLDAFLMDFEDNSKSIFLINELEKFNHHLDVMLKRKFYISNLHFQDIGQYLNERNLGIDNFSSKELDNHITSTKRIIEYIEEIINLEKYDSEVNNKKSSPKNDESINDLLNSTIEDHLEEFKDYIKYDDYTILIEALYQFFKTGSFPFLAKKIEFKKINIKKVGWALKELYHSEKTESLSYTYLLFAKENINLFEKVELSKEDFKTCNLYKYFTTNPGN